MFARPDTSRLNAIPAPAGNKLTPAKVSLGKKLFFNKRLSGDNSRSCSTCHDPNRAFTDGRERAAARDGKTMLLNTPTLLNLAWAKRLFWDGRARALEDQANIPIEHPQEMNGSWPTIIARLNSDETVTAKFKQAFPDQPAPTPQTVAAALASYQRTLISPTTRFDRFIAGDQSALTKPEQAGFNLFVGKAGCIGCHSGWRFTDDRLHTVPVAGSTTSQQRTIKTPSLRGAPKSAPYMHNGALPTLEHVIRHYQFSIETRLNFSTGLIHPLRLSHTEEIALLAFLKSINSIN
ncbi:MAG: tryptophan tryptophylquinone biosynthesis enzyme MauG [Alphaproteobacteria bacterium]|nr:tryptophan tryptophylquinone biosynthesis enzyme MauG [Alphaproteobacteria bacterium]